jgi:hypothetical protein
VTFESFLEGDLTTAGHLEALLGAGVCFYLWHFDNLLRLLPAGGPERTVHLLSLVGKLERKSMEIRLYSKNFT